MKKLYILFIISILLFGHTLLFKSTESRYEVFVRSNSATLLHLIEKNYSKVTNYQKNSSGGAFFPTITNSTYLIKDDLVAFSDRLVYLGNEEIFVYISSSRKTGIKVEYLDNIGTTVFEKELILDKPKSNNYLEFNTQTGFDASYFSKIQIDRKQHSGWVQITISTAINKIYIPVFIQTDKLKTKRSDLLWVESTDTLKAYRSENGLPNNYESKNYSKTGVFTRPFGYPVSYKIQKLYNQKVSFSDCYDHLINADIVLKNTVRKMGYKFDTASDEAIEDYNYIKSYKTLIFGSHNEYWSSKKLQSVAEYLDKGGKVLILGGNTAWRFKEKLNTFDVFYGVGYNDTEYFSFTEKYFGSHYDLRGYATYSGFSPTGNLSEFLGVPQLNKTFGGKTNILGCEEIKGASGHETDKLVATGKNFEILARGNNPESGGAEVLYKKFQGGGEILNFGSVALWHGMGDPKIRQILSKFLMK